MGLKAAQAARARVVGGEEHRAYLLGLRKRRKWEDDARGAEYYHKHHAARLKEFAHDVDQSDQWHGKMHPRRMADSLATVAHNLHHFGFRRANKHLLKADPDAYHRALAEEAFKHVAHETMAPIHERHKAGVPLLPHEAAFHRKYTAKHGEVPPEWGR